jgi:carbonic anhydrase
MTIAMSKKPITGICVKTCFLLCFWLAATVIRTGASQIAEPAEPAEQHQHQAHHMNVPMGEEKCEAKYTYDESPLGPSHWPGVCNTGIMQAPIDIDQAERLPINNLRFLYKPVDLDVINDCNRYRILVRFPDNDWLMVGKKPYFLSELHFRAPGENAVGGKRPRMSVQLVHLSAESRFLIVEVPVIAGRENAAMKTLLEHVPAPGREIKAGGVKIDAAGFLPADRNFYRFPGSLTTPICNEDVMWYVMKNPIELSEAQIAEYLKYYHNTARPLQPLQHRPVAVSE